MSLHVDQIIVDSFSSNTFSSTTIYIGPDLISVHDLFVNSTGDTISGDVQILGDLSANTIFSGANSLSTVITNIFNDNIVTGLTTLVQSGLNTFTGGTLSKPTINITGLTIDNVYVSGVSNFNSAIGSGTISGSTIIDSVVTPKGTLIIIGRDANNSITGLTKDNGALGIRNFQFNRNSQNKITGWTVST
jgi:hypothetical protein